MTAEHLRPLFDYAHDTARFWRFSEDLARAFVPEEIVNSIRLGRLTALQKPSGGVRGIVCVDTIRHIVAKTIAQQFSEVVQRATAPFQYALSTNSGPESIAHALKAHGSGRTRHCVKDGWHRRFRPHFSCRCGKACVPLKVVIRSFRLCCSSRATHLLSLGRR